MTKKYGVKNIILYNACMSNSYLILKREEQNINMRIFESLNEDDIICENVNKEKTEILSLETKYKKIINECVSVIKSIIPEANVSTFNIKPNISDNGKFLRYEYDTVLFDLDQKINKLKELSGEKNDSAAYIYFDKLMSDKLKNKGFIQGDHRHLEFYPKDIKRTSITRHGSCIVASMEIIIIKGKGVLRESMETVVQEGFLENFKKKMEERKNKRIERREKRKAEKIEQLRIRKEAIDKSYADIIKGYEKVLGRDNMAHIKSMRKETLVTRTVELVQYFEDYSDVDLTSELKKIEKSILNLESEIKTFRIAAGVGGVIGTLLSAGDPDEQEKLETAKERAFKELKKMERDLEGLYDDKADIEAIILIRKVIVAADIDISFHGLNESFVEIMESLILTIEEEEC